MNCTDFDNLYNEIVTHVSMTSQIFWTVALSFSLVFSFTMLISGERMIRPTTVIVSGCAGVVLGYAVSSNFLSTDCEIKLIISGVFGLVLSFLGFCLIKTGVFILGAVAFGTVAHYVVGVIPVSALPKYFTFQNRNGVYWIATFGSGALGAILTTCFKKDFLILVTSMLGGSGIAFSMHVIFERFLNPNVYLPSFLYLLAAILGTFFGVTVQRYRNNKKKYLSDKHTKRLVKETILSGV